MIKTKDSPNAVKARNAKREAALKESGLIKKNLWIPAECEKEFNDLALIRRIEYKKPLPNDKPA